MEKENVIQKIQKLLHLQYGAEQIGNEGEAFQAARMVRKLLMDYNLSMTDINTEEKDNTVAITQGEELSGTDRYGNKWKFHLLCVIAKNNLCTACQRRNGKIFVIGTEDNVIVVQEMYKYLVKVFRLLAKKHWQKRCQKWEDEGYNVEYILSNNQPVVNKFYRSYFAGVPLGLQANYDSLKPTSEETALVLCHQKSIDSYISENYKVDNTKSRNRKQKVYGDVFDLGFNDARNISLNKQLKEK